MMSIVREQESVVMLLGECICPKLVSLEHVLQATQVFLLLHGNYLSCLLEIPSNLFVLINESLMLLVLFLGSLLQRDA